MEGGGLLTFLDSKFPCEKLDAALEVLEAFKNCESVEEWAGFPFISWARLEQFEDYLRLLTGKDIEKVDDEVAKKYVMKKIRIDGL